MKLIVAIVQDEDADRLSRVLINERYNITKIATTGGFLRTGNATFLIGTPDERVQNAIDILEKQCKSRKHTAISPAPLSGAFGYIPVPIDVIVGGSTIFVINVEQFEKL